jgi:hypothetical protein
MTAWIIGISVIYGIIITMVCVFLFKRYNSISGELRSEMEKTHSLRATITRRDKLIADLKRIENETEEKKDSYHTSDPVANFDKSKYVLRNLPKR